MLKQEIGWIKEGLDDPSIPFGVDLAIPQIGGSARKTNHDYTHGRDGLHPLGLLVFTITGPIIE